MTNDIYRAIFSYCFTPFSTRFVRFLHIPAMLFFVDILLPTSFFPSYIGNQYPHNLSFAVETSGPQPCGIV